MAKKSTHKSNIITYRKKKATKQLIKEHEMGLLTNEELSYELNEIWGI